MANLTDDEQKQLDALNAKKVAPEPEPVPDPVDPSSAEDLHRRLRALEVSLGHPVDQTRHRLVAINGRRVMHAEVDPERVGYVQHPVTGANVLVFDGKACPRGVVSVEGVPCYLELGTQTQLAKRQSEEQDSLNAEAEAKLLAEAVAAQQKAKTS
jgi:hypothetical protein